MRDVVEARARALKVEEKKKEVRKRCMIVYYILLYHVLEVRWRNGGALEEECKKEGILVMTVSR